MIDIKVLYVANIFVSNSIEPSAKNISYFATAFEDRGLVPTIFKQVTNLQTQNRLQLSSSDNQWTIRFLDDRIDIVRATKSFNSDIGEFEDFCNNAIDIWQKIDTKFKKTAKRIGITSTVILKEMTDSEIDKIFRKLFIPIPLYDLDKPISWENELVSRIPKKILDIDELINIGVNLKRVQGQFKDNDSIVDFDRVQISLHINTASENAEYRFKDVAIVDFLKSVSSWQLELSNSVLNHIS